MSKRLWGHFRCCCCCCYQHTVLLFSATPFSTQQNRQTAAEPSHKSTDTTKNLKSPSQVPEVTDFACPFLFFPNSGMQPNWDFLPPNAQPITACAQAETSPFRRQPRFVIGPRDVRNTRVAQAPRCRLTRKPMCRFEEFK